MIEQLPKVINKEIWEIMKVAVSEYSSGFSDYSHFLCDELIKENAFDEVAYLTDDINEYLSKVNRRVRKVRLYKSFSNDSSLKKGSRSWYFDRGVTALSNCLRRENFIKKEGIDATIIQATLAVIDRFFIGRLRKHSKVILTVHDVVVPVDSPSWSMRSLKEMYDDADALVVHSNTNRDQMKDLFSISSDKVHVIPHGVEKKVNRLDREESRKKLGLKAEDKVLLFYGSIRKSKGLDVLLNALKGLNAVLVIAGQPFFGESFDPYKRLIEKNGLRTVEFIEFTEDSFRDVLFSASDFLVLPYREFY